MKKAVAIVAIVLFFLILLGLLFIKLLWPSKPATDVTIAPATPTSTIPDPQVDGGPDQVAHSCYQWYVQRYAIYQQALGIEKTDPNIVRCFTGSFISQWESGDNADTDPVLSSQNYETSWKDTVTSRIVGISTADADVLVQMGTADNTHIVLAHMRRNQTTGQWRIDSVTPQD